MTGPFWYLLRMLTSMVIGGKDVPGLAHSLPLLTFYLFFSVRLVYLTTHKIPESREGLRQKKSVSLCCYLQVEQLYK